MYRDEGLLPPDRWVSSHYLGTLDSRGGTERSRGTVIPGLVLAVALTGLDRTRVLKRKPGDHLWPRERGHPTGAGLGGRQVVSSRSFHVWPFEGTTQSPLQGEDLAATRAST